MDTKLNIVDVNRFNPSVDWAKVAEQTDGVIIRVGYRGLTGQVTSDPNYKKFLKGAIDAGVKRIGLYWWSCHTDPSEADVDAAYLMTLVSQFKEHINFGVWLRSQPFPEKCEFNEMSAEDRTECALAFLKEIKVQGLWGGVYADEDWFNEQLVLDDLSDQPLWVAHHGDTPPETVKNYAGWQYAEGAKVDGVTRGAGLSWFADLAAK